MTLRHLIRFAAAYASLGDAVQHQLHALVRGEDDINPNALLLMTDRLAGYHPDLDALLSESQPAVQA